MNTGVSGSGPSTTGCPFACIDLQAETVKMKMRWERAEQKNHGYNRGRSDRDEQFRNWDYPYQRK